ncbi:PITH domain-containing protein At3g04780 [Carica papaya]|uniref:PITH domain-containing protein At3g04780 n=1 Tax=Carica papaya TaxID=3649 RepID=UPI000B8D0901|nr:PITH domain-containing protein At3g04780 [Carica papaya]
MSTESASAIHRNQVDLLDFIDWSGVECLNQSSSHSLANALKQVISNKFMISCQIFLSVLFGSFIFWIAFIMSFCSLSHLIILISLPIFIEDNQSGSDVTKVHKIALHGTTVETTDMKGLKKIEDH